MTEVRNKWTEESKTSRMKLSIGTFESSYGPSLVITILAEMDSKRFLKVTRFSDDGAISIFGVCHQSCCQNLVKIALTDRVAALEQVTGS